MGQKSKCIVYKIHVGENVSVNFLISVFLILLHLCLRYQCTITPTSFVDISVQVKYSQVVEKIAESEKVFTKTQCKIKPKRFGKNQMKENELLLKPSPIR